MKTESLTTASLFLIGLVLLVGLPTAFAHEHRILTIANQKVEFVVGWVVEPPYVDEVNDIDFHATIVDSGAPVFGLDKALQVEVSTGGQQETLSMTPVLTDDVPPQFFGGYTANIIPTVAGAYAFRFFGNVNGTVVNESFQCGPTTFECVDTQSDIQFPEKLLPVDWSRLVSKTCSHGFRSSKTRSSSRMLLELVESSLGLLV